MDISALILKSSSTKPEALIKLRALSAAISAKLFGGEYHPDAAEEVFIDWVNSTAKEVAVNLDKKTATAAFIAAEKTIKAAPSIVIYLPYPLPSEETAALSKQIKSLLDIKIDPSLIAGCALSNNGVYKDYSLRAKLAEKQNEIMKLCLAK